MFDSISKCFNNNFETILSDHYSSFSKDDIYSSVMVDEEVWLGLDSYILVYNRNLMYEYGKKYEESQMKIFKDINDELS